MIMQKVREIEKIRLAILRTEKSIKLGKNFNEKLILLKEKHKVANQELYNIFNK